MKELSSSEALIMKVVWEFGKDIAIPDLIGEVQKQYGKEYKRTTVGTFLSRLSEKGYVSTYRTGKLAYVHADILEQDYKEMLARKHVDFWFKGSASEFFSALCHTKTIDKNELERIQEMLNDMDN